MFNLFKKEEKPLNSEEFEKILKRCVDLEQRIRRLELNEDDFRDKVLRKLQRREKEGTLEIEQPQTYNYNGIKVFGGKR